MSGWFAFKGVDSREMGVVVDEYPAPARAAERVEMIPVPGRHGALTIAEGLDGTPVYDEMELSMQLIVTPAASITAVSGWLTGAGELVLGNDSNYRRRVRMTKQLEYERVLRGRAYRRVELTMSAAPFKRLAEPLSEMITSAPYALINPGTLPSEPLITLTGSGDITLLLGDAALQVAALSGSIIIDCEARLAYSGTTLLTGKLTGDWPQLPVGSVGINWTGNVSELSIQPNWRWL